MLSSVSTVLRSNKHDLEADALADVHEHCLADADFGGLGYTADQELDKTQQSEVLFLVSSYLEALNSQDRYSSPLIPLDSRPAGRRGMTLAEKIFAAHDVERKGEVKPGDVIRADIDWVIASELSWSGMEKRYEELGEPGIFRNDRLWIAGDHVVDPRVKNVPKIKSLVDSAERARQIFKLTEFQGMNYTIMHTEFCRERAQPGQLVIGSDSHTCSAGSVSALAIGLGVVDVTLPLITGQTWFKVPETVEIRFVDEPKPGLGGKDIILYVLKELKRNTVAADRVVEYTGPGLQQLSCDARFAIANMTKEFGGVSGIFVPDEVTQDFVNKRKNSKYKKLSAYYKPDEDAQYAESHIIDLSKVEPFVARYPKPDDVVPVSEVAGTNLDGCFIGACTTAREDLVLGALVLEAGLKKGLKPVPQGKRKVVPGSRPILHDLKQRGLAKFYEDAGFEIGVPGCSYCVGMSADKAGPGEVWLSSQNRNFENRMGPGMITSCLRDITLITVGAIGSITSAVTVAASSFDMRITDPKPLLDAIDQSKVAETLGRMTLPSLGLKYVEPGMGTTKAAAQAELSEPQLPSQPAEEDVLLKAQATEDEQTASPQNIKGRIQRLGDFIDTDALAPNEAIVQHLEPEELGTYCLKYTHPDFRRRAKDEGMDVVVAGKAFGVGSSRENAVTALQGTGIQAVIARSFAFIYGRNQPNLGLLGFVMDDEEFYKLAADGEQIEIDVTGRTAKIGGKIFPFQLSELEWQLVKQGGMTNAFRKWGKGLLEVMTATKPSHGKDVGIIDGKDKFEMQW